MVSIAERRIKESEQDIRDMWDPIEGTNIHILGLLQGEKKEDTYLKNIFEKIMPRSLHAENDKILLKDVKGDLKK